MPVFLVGKSQFYNRPSLVFAVLRKGKPEVDVHVYNDVPFACSLGGIEVEEDDEAMDMVRKRLPEDPGPDSPEPLSFRHISESAEKIVQETAELMQTSKVVQLSEDDSWQLVCDLHAGVLGLCHKESYTWSTVDLGVDNRPELDTFAFFPRASGPAADDDRLESRHLDKFKRGLE